MKSYYVLTLGAVALLGAGSTMAFADNNHGHIFSHLDQFTSHHLVDKEKYTHEAETLPMEEKLELREYITYEEREPCQTYQEVPVGFVRDGCNITPINAPMTRIYDIFFDYNSDVIVPEAHKALKKMAREIKDFHSNEVTVAGYTDTSGNAAYNKALSKRRAVAVSSALTDLGVKNQVIRESARGETNLAVKTGDGVALHENRRVEIMFKR